MMVSALRNLEAEEAFLNRRFNEEMAASRAARSPFARRAHAELACRYAVRVANLERQRFNTQHELPFTPPRKMASAS
jgi:hypothetical protein